MKRTANQAGISNREEDSQIQSKLKKKKIADSAQKYIFKVFDRFSEDALTRHQFITLLSEYKSKSLPIFEVLAQINQLFVGHPDLIIEFKHFLPETLGIKPGIGTHPKDENIHIKLLESLRKKLSKTDFEQLLDLLKSFHKRKIGRQQLTELMETLMNKYKFGQDSIEYKHFFGWIVDPLAMNTNELLDEFEINKEYIKRTRTTLLPQEVVVYQPLTYPPTLVTENDRTVNRSNHVFDYQYGIKSIGPSYIMQKFDDVEFNPTWCGGRTLVDQAVLNDEYLCVGNDSPLYHHGSLTTFTIPELQRMEEVFLKESNLSSIDIQLDLINNTILEFSLYMNALNNNESPKVLITSTEPEMSTVRKDRFKQEDNDVSESINTILNREHITSVHRVLLRKIYRHGYRRIIKYLRETPSRSIPVVLKRLKGVKEELSKKRTLVVDILRETNLEAAYQQLIHNSNRFRSLEASLLDQLNIKKEIQRNLLTLEFSKRSIHRSLYSVIYQSSSNPNKAMIKNIWRDWIIPLFRLEPKKLDAEPTTFMHQKQLFGQLVTKEMIEFMFYYHLLYRRLKRAFRNFKRKIKMDCHRVKKQVISKDLVKTIKSSQDYQFFNIDLPDPFDPSLSIDSWDSSMFQTKFIPTIIRHLEDRNVNLSKQRHYEMYCIKCLGMNAYEFFTIRQVVGGFMRTIKALNTQQQYHFCKYQYSIFSNPSVIRKRQAIIDNFVTKIDEKPVFIVLQMKHPYQSITFQHLPFVKDSPNSTVASSTLLSDRQQYVARFVSHRSKSTKGVFLRRSLSRNLKHRYQSNGLEWQLSSTSNLLEPTAHTQDVLLK